jgi:hypothetical protein
VSTNPPLRTQTDCVDEKNGLTGLPSTLMPRSRVLVLPSNPSVIRVVKTYCAAPAGGVP